MKETGIKIGVGNLYPANISIRDISNTGIEMIKGNESLYGPFEIENYSSGLIPIERRQKVVEWQNAEATISYYEPAEYTDTEGKKHRHQIGSLLLIGSEQVMDTCERPWSEAVVKGIFDGFPGSLSPLETDKPSVLLRGFGLGDQAQLLLNELLVKRGGELHIIELNKDLAQNMALQFLQDAKNLLFSTFRYGNIPDIKLNLHIGDAAYITEKLMKSGKKFDVIISDTYPLSPEEQGLNDILDLKNQIKCLTEKGRYSFFPYFPGFKDNGSGMTTLQQEIIQPNFDTIVSKLRIANVDNYSKKIGVPKSYKFLQRSGSPIEYLPVVICTDRRL